MQCLDKKTIWPHRSIEWCDAGNEEKPISVPCGKCAACLVSKRNDWTYRLQQEHKASRSAHFVTLTYDAKHIRTDHSLNKRDLQLYIKRLRKKDETTRIRYYAVGEYGTQTKRPHYHRIPFNLKFDQLQERSNSCQNGHVRVDPINEARIHYVTKYHVNFNKKDKLRTPEFALMSRKPGIGFEYIGRLKDWHYNNEAIHVINNGYKQRLPRYYKDRIFDARTKKRLTEKGTLEALNGYYRELERLAAIGYTDPQKELRSREVLASTKVIDKGGLTDLL